MNKADPLHQATRAQFKELLPLATLYINQKAVAEIRREQVDAIAAEILANDIEIYSDLEGPDRARITRFKDAYLSEDDEACKALFQAVNIACRKAKIKPPEMDDEYCPALVAEHKANKTWRRIIEGACKILGMDPMDVICTVPMQQEEFFGLIMNVILHA